MALGGRGRASAIVSKLGACLLAGWRWRWRWGCVANPNSAHSCIAIGAWPARSHAYLRICDVVAGNETRGTRWGGCWSISSSAGWAPTCNPRTTSEATPGHLCTTSPHFSTSFPLPTSLSFRLHLLSCPWYDFPLPCSSSSLFIMCIASCFLRSIGIADPISSVDFPHANKCGIA